MPKYYGLLAAGTVAAATVAFSSIAEAKVANPDLIPTEAAVTVSIPDAAALLTASEANALFKASNEQLGPFLKDKLAEEGALDKIASLEKVLGFELTASNVIGTFKSLDAYVLPGDSADDTAVAAILTVADKKRADQIISLATMSATEAAGSEKKPTTSEYKGSEISKYGEGETSVYVVRTDEAILISNKESEIKALVDRTKEKSDSALSGNADYKTVSEALAQESGEFYVYTNTEALNELTQAGNAGDPFTAFSSKIQPTTFNGFVVKFAPKSIIAYSAAVLGKGGLAEFIRKNPGTKIDSAGFATADSLLFLGTSVLDSKAIQAGIEEMSGVIPNADEAKAQIAGVEGMLGFSLTDDLVPAIGNEFAIIVNKVDLDSGPMPSVDAGIVIKVGDEAKLKKILTALEKLGANALSGGQPGAKETFDSETIGGAEVKMIPAPVPFIQPGFTIHDGYLIIASTKSGMEGLIKAKGGSSNLVSSDSFKKLAPRITDSGQSLTYLNSGAIATLGLKVAKDRAAGDKDAEAAIKRVGAVVATIGALVGTQTVKDGLLVSYSELTLN